MLPALVFLSYQIRYLIVTLTIFSETKKRFEELDCRWQRFQSISAWIKCFSQVTLVFFPHQNRRPVIYIWLQCYAEESYGRFSGSHKRLLDLHTYIHIYDFFSQSCIIFKQHLTHRARIFYELTIANHVSRICGLKCNKYILSIGMLAL